MIKYHGDRLWVKIQLALAALLWGLLVAFITVKVTEHLTGWIVTPLRLLVFLLGYTTLDIGVKQGREAEIIE